jgi:hypothetical protein
MAGFHILFANDQIQWSKKNLKVQQESLYDCASRYVQLGRVHHHLAYSGWAAELSLDLN